MIKDITGTILTPGNFGKDCKGNGRHYDKNGKLIECCCEECAYLMCCVEADFEKACRDCYDLRCPRCKKGFFKKLVYYYKNLR